MYALLSFKDGAFILKLKLKLSGNNYRVATLPKSYIIVIGIIVGQF